MFYNEFYEMLLQQAHVLIAGAPCSGKSTLIHGILYEILMQRKPTDAKIALIDPKRVTLYKYSCLPHTLFYTDCAANSEAGSSARESDAAEALERVFDEIGARLDCMQEAGEEDYTGADIYIFVDELSDIAEDRKAMQILQKIAKLGKAAKVHLIAATRSLSRSIVSESLKICFDCRVSLRCASALESVKAVGAKGAECLPKFGQCLLLSPDTFSPEIVDLPNPVPKEKIDQAISVWSYIARQTNMIPV